MQPTPDTTKPAFLRAYFLLAVYKKELYSTKNFFMKNQKKKNRDLVTLVLETTRKLMINEASLTSHEKDLKDKKFTYPR